MVYAFSRHWPISHTRNHKLSMTHARWLIFKLIAQQREKRKTNKPPKHRDTTSILYLSWLALWVCLICITTNLWRLFPWLASEILNTKLCLVVRLLCFHASSCTRVMHASLFWRNIQTRNYFLTDSLTRLLQLHARRGKVLPKNFMKTVFVLKTMLKPEPRSLRGRWKSSAPILQRRSRECAKRYRRRRNALKWLEGRRLSILLRRNLSTDRFITVWERNSK